ncbi:hypothetical protein [Dictyobacter kobayashii]|uniref:hypothetical protein n=1 Tax=Dictyobacter kobayashii TaxID=2014872 RepID=UPI000F839917|nr:hypothetical protein [Dictyobacter kobayashii]
MADAKGQEHTFQIRLGWCDCLFFDSSMIMPQQDNVVKYFYDNFDASPKIQAIGTYKIQAKTLEPGY